ncbi:ROK family protein [Pseudarthrobacter sp. NamE2]|uniref:ROK family protein n=1 Tax=Pseudarthrobacter sp. NamE2 TaxID=2576838 RepID=UPI0010FD868D|nr:ROK family protein [Pseudarthrobacter sp. NamE2]TLM83592.1 ROK family protein [Pseudarthrobacter sp. NamE2]
MGMDHSRTLSLVLGLIRSGDATTRPELIRRTDLGRALVSQRVEDALEAGLIEELDEGVSKGGRPARTLRVRADRGRVLTAVFGASRVAISLTDLAGRVETESYTAWDINNGPEASLSLLRDAAAAMLVPTAPLWAVVIGVPGPVSVSIGSPVHPPIMAGWHAYPVREWLEREYGVPAFVENDANLMALGTWQRLRRQSGDDVVFIKAGTGLGAGIIADGELVRGDRGAAGDFGHTTVAEYSRVQCRCGNFGCLEALAGGWALARDGYTAAFTRDSTFLQDRIARQGGLTFEDIVAGSLAADPVSRELIDRSGTLIGASLATVVNLLNPATVFVGGGLALAGRPFFEAIAEQVRRRSQPLATERLVVRNVPLNHREGNIGAAVLALDALLDPRMLSRWVDRGSPRGVSAQAEPDSEHQPSDSAAPATPGPKLRLDPLEDAPVPQASRSAS